MISLLFFSLIDGVLLLNHLRDIEVVLFNKFPIVFAKSLLIMSTNLLSWKSPSLPKDISLSKYHLTDSSPYLLSKISGSNTFPKLLPIFWPSLVKNPCPNIFLGGFIPAEISIAGQ